MPRIISVRVRSLSSRLLAGVGFLLPACCPQLTFAQPQTGETPQLRFETRHRVNAHGDEFNALARSSDGSRLFIGTERGDIIVWNTATQQTERRLHQSSAV